LLPGSGSGGKKVIQGGRSGAGTGFSMLF